jgi:deoxycytidine triphosphate deaminase
MLLNKQRLLIELEKGNILSKYSFEDSIPDKNIKPSSLDLTVKYIFLPADKKIRKSNKSALNEYRHDNYELGPGEVVLIEVNERFNMPTNMAGIIFPPNGLSKSGLIMTNPGHIDPGFRGIITLCLVNMGKRDVHLRTGKVICRLLTFDIGEDSLGKISRGNGVDIDQFNHIDRDFASVNDRALGAIKSYLNKAIPVIGIFFAAVAILVPFISSLSEKAFLGDSVEKSVSTNLEENVQPELKKLRKELESLQKDIEILCQTSVQVNCPNKGNL